MILVDTSVWVDFFAGAARPQAARLEQAIEQDEDLALCGIVLTEILQGIANDRVYQRVREHLRPLAMLPMTEAVFVEAADIYRQLRKRGITGRKTNDCIIAATALAHKCQLLHQDKGFSAIAAHYPLDTLAS